MLRSAIICPDSIIREQLERILTEVVGLVVIRSLERYPTTEELLRFVRAQSPDLIFLSVESLKQALAIHTELEKSSRNIQVIAIHGNCQPDILLEVMRAGIREFVTAPFDRVSLMESMRRVQEALDKKPVVTEASDLVYSFLPSKAGVGTSTIALNTAIAISKIDSTNTFLGDFDLNSGMVRFMLKLKNTYSVVDAAERSLDIDENFWPQLVTSIGALDVLHAGKLNPNFRMEAGQMRNLLDFTRRNYQVICADLSGNLEKYSIELMHESKRIFLVCTPEIPSLHLAREKYQHLQSLGLGDRVSVLLNRCQKRPVLSPAQIEELLGLQIHMTFPNDYQCVNRALADGRPIDFSSELGVQCFALAHSMLDRKMTAPTGGETKKRFIDMFSLSPSRYSLEGKKSNA
jgi:pilus assembly protein CpaE